MSSISSGLCEVKCKQIGVCDIVLNGLLMATEELFRVVCDPGAQRRLRFREIVVKGWMREMFIIGKNTIMKLIQIHNGFDGLAREFALLEFVVKTVSLGVVNRIDQGAQGAENTKLVNHFRIKAIQGELI